MTDRPGTPPVAAPTPPAPWEAPLRAAWREALTTLHATTPGLDPAGLRAATEAVGAAVHRLSSLARHDPDRAAATAAALTWLTEDWIRQPDSLGLLTWILGQSSQLAARLDSWQSVEAPGGDERTLKALPQRGATHDY